MSAKSGKSVLSLGLATNYPGKAGFYKPFRENPVMAGSKMMDQDALLMTEVLGLDEKKDPSPFIYDLYEPVKMEEIVSKYGELCKGKDFMIIEGPRDPASGYAHGVSNTDIAKEIKAPVLLVATPSQQSIDTIFMYKEICKQKKIDILGAVINNSSGFSEHRFLEERGIKVLGEIPVMPELKTFKVSELSEKMDAKAVAGTKGMDNMVETMMVGAMSIQSAIGYLRRTKRKALITGGDRTEMLIAALSTDTSCIIVTGGIMPSHTVLARADELGIPVLMTSSDTLHITEVIEHLIVRIDHKDKEKIDLVRRTVRNSVDLDVIFGR